MSSGTVNNLGTGNIHGLMLCCKVCDHEWLQRQQTLPKTCPRCGSRYWNEGRKRPPRAEQLRNAEQRRQERSQQDSGGRAKGKSVETKGLVIVAAEVQIPHLAKPPCGPWKEAVALAETIGFTHELASLIGYREGDVLVTAAGQSMEGAGIPEGSLILLRPLRGRKPRPGSIVLAQAFLTNGEVVSTVKRWHPHASGIPDLRDGNGHPNQIPHDTERIELVAYMVGIVARTTDAEEGNE